MSEDRDLLGEAYALVNGYYCYNAKKPEMLVVSVDRKKLMQEHVSKCMAFMGSQSLATMKQVSQYFGIGVAVCETLDCDWKVY